MDRTRLSGIRVKNSEEFKTAARIIMDNIGWHYTEESVDYWAGVYNKLFEISQAIETEPSPAELKIAELEKTIAEAQSQLAELKQITSP